MRGVQLLNGPRLVGSQFEGVLRGLPVGTITRGTLRFFECFDRFATFLCATTQDVSTYGIIIGVYRYHFMI
jgi:hypothetical protein